MSEPVAEARVSPFCFWTWSPSWERVRREEKGEVLETFPRAFAHIHTHTSWGHWHLMRLQSRAISGGLGNAWLAPQGPAWPATGSSVSRAGMCFMARLAVSRESCWSWCFAPGLKNPIVKPRCLSRCLLILILSNSRVFGVVCRPGIFD